MYAFLGMNGEYLAVFAFKDLLPGSLPRLAKFYGANSQYEEATRLGPAHTIVSLLRHHPAIGPIAGYPRESAAGELPQETYLPAYNPPKITVASITISNFADYNSTLTQTQTVAGTVRGNPAFTTAIGSRSCRRVPQY